MGTVHVGTVLWDADAASCNKLERLSEGNARAALRIAVTREPCFVAVRLEK